MAGSFSEIKLPDIAILQQLARDQLVLNLEAIPGKKDLVIDTELMKPLDRIAGAALLKTHGVDKIYRLEPTISQVGCDRRIYLVRPCLKIMKIIADQVNADRKAGQKKEFIIFNVPRKLQACELLLEQEGVAGYVTSSEFVLDLIPLDKDILSLELPEFFKSYFLHGDQTGCHSIAMSLVRIQQVFGLIPNTYCIGQCSKVVYELSQLLFEPIGEPKHVDTEIGQLFIIDRSHDLVTPTCSQVTYEGVLDDTFDVECGYVTFGSEVTGREQSVKLLLDSSDLLYQEIRGRHFSNVSSYLSATAKELQTVYDKRHGLTSVQEMKSFVANDLKGLTQQHKSLSLHIGACEVIMKKKNKVVFEDELATEHSLLEGVDTRESMRYIEEIINRQCSVQQSLRLLCLLSLTQGGLSATDYKSLKTQFLQSYGLHYLPCLHQLQKLGMFTETEAILGGRGQLAEKMAAHLPRTSAFRQLCKRLGLIPKASEEINLHNPTDMSYVFSGAYTPLLCRLIEQVLTKGSLRGLEDVTRLFPGPCMEKMRDKSAKVTNVREMTPEVDDPSKIVLVYFLGGCNFSEIAALRLLGRIKGYRFLIATTAIFNRGGLIQQVIKA